MWYYMASGRWAEVGVSYGYNTNNGACEMSQVFWAQNNSNGYSEYWPGTTWSFDNWEYVYVERTTSTSCSWYVFFSANRIGTSTNNCAETGRALQAGIEATTTGNGSPGGYVRGWLENWERKDSSGTWHDGWDSPGIFQDNPPKMKWNNAGHTETQEVLNESYL
jgi:hypothetical protein